MDNQLESSISNQHTIRLKLFENRWRFAVFPAMIAFFMLSGFGFYLIWGMLDRMQALSNDLNRMTRVISESMPVMQGGIVGMSSKMQKVGEDLNKMAADVRIMSNVVGKTMPQMEDRLVEMSNTMHMMSYSTASMANTTDNMGRNIWSLNRSISKPMSFFGDMMPWSSNGNSVPPPPPAVRPVAMQPVYNYTQPYTQVAKANTVPAVALNTNSPKQVAQDSAVTEGEHQFNGYCSSCHGINGEGGVGPSLLNTNAVDINEMLLDYKSGQLEGTTMPSVMNTLSNSDIKKISEYIGKRFKSNNIKTK